MNDGPSATTSPAVPPIPAPAPRAAGGDFDQADRAIVADDGRTIRLSLYGPEGAIGAAELDPVRAVALAGELIEAACSKLPPAGRGQGRNPAPPMVKAKPSVGDSFADSMDDDEAFGPPGNA